MRRWKDWSPGLLYSSSSSSSSSSFPPPSSSSIIIPTLKTDQNWLVFNGGAASPLPTLTRTNQKTQFDIIFNEISFLPSSKAVRSLGYEANDALRKIVHTQTFLDQVLEYPDIEHHSLRHRLHCHSGLVTTNSALESAAFQATLRHSDLINLFT